MRLSMLSTLQMTDHVRRYFGGFLTQGTESLAEELLDADVVHKDVIWVSNVGKGFVDVSGKGRLAVDAVAASALRPCTSDWLSGTRTSCRTRRIRRPGLRA